jgi:hypothetical protein
MELTLLGIGTVLLFIWLFLRRRGRVTQERSTPTPRRKEDTAYHAVSIKFSEGACAAAKAMSGRRFLANAAPRLPLPECDVATCACRFAHHKDRRAGRDRRSPFAAGNLTGATGRHEKERRERSDRRKDADADLF